MTANENLELDLEDRLAQLWRDRVNLSTQTAAIDVFDQKVQLLRYDMAEFVAEIDRLSSELVEAEGNGDQLRLALADQQAQLARVRERAYMLEEILTKALRNPTFPLGEFLKRRLAFAAAKLVKPVSKRASIRLKNSARKRDPRRYLSNREAVALVQAAATSDYDFQSRSIVSSYFPVDYRDPPPPLHIQLDSGVLVRSQFKSVSGKFAAPSVGTPKFSIITPFFAHLDYFIECAKSVAALVEAGAPDFEWIVFNDDPSIPDDKLENLLPKAIRMRTRVISDGRNHGITEAINRAIRASTKDWAVLLDCDDLLEPDALSALSAAILDDPQCRYFTSLMTDIDETGREIRKRMPSGELIDLFEKGMIAGHLVAFRRDLYDDLGGFDARFSGVQDYEFVLRVAAQEKISRINHHLYRYRWHTKTQSVSRMNRQFRLANAARMAFLRETMGLCVPSEVRSPLPEAPEVFCVIRTQGHRMELLAAAVASVQAQACPATACIVVHGDDETLAFVRRYLTLALGDVKSAHPPIILHAPRTDLRRGYPCNVALDYLTAHADHYDLLCFLDDDDHLLPHFAERLVLLMRLTGADMSYGQANAIPLHGEPFVQHRLRPWLSVLASNFITFNSFMLRVDAFIQSGATFRTDMHYLEDHHFLIQLIGAGVRAAALSEVVSEYRLLGDGNSDQKQDMVQYRLCEKKVKQLAKTVAQGLPTKAFWDDVLAFPTEERDSFDEGELMILRKTQDMVKGAARG